jgi:hypothetical protein
MVSILIIKPERGSRSKVFPTPPCPFCESWDFFTPSPLRSFWRSERGTGGALEVFLSDRPLAPITEALGSKAKEEKGIETALKNLFSMKT